LDRKKEIKHFRDLAVYRRAFKAALKIFKLTKEFPVEERYSMVDQIRRASRSVFNLIVKILTSYLLNFLIVDTLTLLWWRK